MSQSDFVTRGQSLVSSGQYQEAVKVCRLGLLGRPTTVEGRVVLGQALLALKRYDEVLAEMRVALELDHTSHAAQVLKGEALLRKGDGHGSLEVLGALRSQGVADAHVAELIAEAERLASRSPPGNARLAVGFLAQDPTAFAAEQGTKNYPGIDPHAFEEAAAEFTSPTSLAAPNARRRSSPELSSTPDRTPPPAVLAVGDRSGTVEVDPDVEGLEVGTNEDDFGDVVDPPLDGGGFDLEAATGVRPGARGSVSASAKSPRSSAAAAAAVAKKTRRAAMFKEEVSTVELGDDEVIELDEKREADTQRKRKVSGPGTAVRNAVKMPSGPIDQSSAARPAGQPSSLDQPPAHLAQRIANQPHVMNVMSAAPLPVHPQINPRSAIAAAMPTAAAMQPPMGQPMNRQGMPGQPMMGQPGQPMMGQPGQPMMGPGQPMMGPGQPMMGQPGQPMMGPGQPMMGQPGQPMMGQPGQPMMGQPGQPMMGQPGQPMMGPGQPMMGQGMQPPKHLQQTMLAPPNAAAYAQQQLLPPHLQAAVRPTIALPSQQQPLAAGGNAMFNGQGQDGPSPSWARPTVMPSGSPPYGARAAADEPIRQPLPIDAQIAAMQVGQGSGGVPLMAYTGDPASSPSRLGRSGGRKARSRLQIIVWVMIGAAVISGGVFAGFQIRNLRLHRQIAAARDRAVDVAKADNWQGWLGARDSLYSIAQAQPTVDNRAALARARGVLAFEFGDGLHDAKTAVDTHPGKSGLDFDLAAAYVALAQREARTAHDATERALQEAATDPAALYLSGQAALLGGDLKAAITALRGAVERESRPHYLVGLARALGDAAAWDEALAAVERARDNPGALITKAVLLTGAGRIVAGTGGPGGELRAQLAKLVTDVQKSGDQAVSPAQVAFADLALARIDFARGDRRAAHADYLASLDVRFDDQRFGEELGDTVLAIGEPEAALKIATRTIKQWPASVRARITLAQISLALGKPAAALELFNKTPEAAAGPVGQTVRGQARQAAGDLDGARADFDVAIKKLPGFEPAVIARAWLDLAAGEIAEARRRIVPTFNAKTATAAMAAIYAAIQRIDGDPAERAKAKLLLERVVGAPGPDAARAQLELARISRDLGDMKAAGNAYAEASRAGSPEARLESGALLIDTGDPRGGRETFDQLLKEAGDRPTPVLLLEAARAHTLMGDHTGALALLARADKSPAVVRWQLDRERGRIALRRNDTAGAAQQVGRALDGCGSDLDTFLLAADTVSADDKLTTLTQKLRAAMATRLKGRPEFNIITGKLYLSGNQYAEAEKVYDAARAALIKDHASPRRLAQANFGLAAIAYFRRDDPVATNGFELAMMEDPSIYSVYLFAAEIARAKDPAAALEQARKAVAYNPDSIEGWKMVGSLAAQLPRQRKLLDEAITRLGDLAPGSEALRQLQRLK